nr:MAG TPA: hypothetical protein [Caudoviricetes sp.]
MPQSCVYRSVPVNPSYGSGTPEEQPACRTGLPGRAGQSSPRRNAQI